MQWKLHTGRQLLGSYHAHTPKKEKEKKKNDGCCCYLMAFVDSPCQADSYSPHPHPPPPPTLTPAPLQHVFSIALMKSGRQCLYNSSDQNNLACVQSCCVFFSFSPLLFPLHTPPEGGRAVPAIACGASLDMGPGCGVRIPLSARKTPAGVFLPCVSVSGWLAGRWDQRETLRAQLAARTEWNAYPQFSSVQFSSVQDGIYALGKAQMRSTPSRRGFPHAAFETVPMFVCTYRRT